MAHSSTPNTRLSSSSSYYTDDLQPVIVCPQNSPAAEALDEEATLEFDILKFIDLTPGEELTTEAVLKRLHAHTGGLEPGRQQAFIADIWHSAESAHETFKGRLQELSVVQHAIIAFSRQKYNESSETTWAGILELAQSTKKLLSSAPRYDIACITFRGRLFQVWGSINIPSSSVRSQGARDWDVREFLRGEDIHISKNPKDPDAPVSERVLRGLVKLTDVVTEIWPGVQPCDNLHKCKGAIRDGQGRRKKGSRTTREVLYSDITCAIGILREEHIRKTTDQGHSSPFHDASSLLPKEVGIASSDSPLSNLISSCHNQKEVSSTETDIQMGDVSNEVLTKRRKTGDISNEVSTKRRKTATKDSYNTKESQSTAENPSSTLSEASGQDSSDWEDTTDSQYIDLESADESMPNGGNASDRLSPAKGLVITRTPRIFSNMSAWNLENQQLTIDWLANTNEITKDEIVTIAKNLVNMLDQPGWPPKCQVCKPLISSIFWVMNLCQKQHSKKNLDSYLFLDAIVSADKVAPLDQAQFRSIVCFTHSGLFARRAAQLQTTKPGENHDKVVDSIFTCLMHWRSGDLADFQWQYPHMFKKGVNPTHPEHLLGPNKYPSQLPQWPQILPSIQRKVLFDDVARTTGSWDEYNSQNTINLGDFFAEFRDDQELMNILHTEFDMFLYHAREEVDGKRVVGWGKNMFFSLSQQLITQDLRFNVLYYLSRLDSSVLEGWINLPYYTRNCQAGDNFEFTHIDNNIRKLIYENKGAHGIQTFVSFDDEDEANCTWGVKGLQLSGSDSQTTLKTVYEWITSKSPDLLRPDHEDFITNLTKVWPSIESNFGQAAKLQPLPNKKMGLRLSKPEMVHGTKVHRAKSQRRRGMAVWLTGVRSDSSLDNRDIGLESEIQQSNLKQIPHPISYSGYPLRQCKVMGTYLRHPFTVHLPPVTAIGGMVVCAVDREDPTIKRELSIVLGDDRAAANELFQKSRQESIAMVKKCWPIFQQAERDAYGSNSFFVNSKQQE